MLFEKTLSNGLDLIIQKTSAPVVSVHVWVDVGSIDERPEEAGFCHFLEHMLFKGTSKRTTSQIAGTVEGAGGEMNAFTSFEYTAYHITLSNEKWSLANEILADMVLNSAFKPGEFTPEKEVILEEIKRGEDSPERQLYHGMYRMQWGSIGYGRPVIGYPKTVSACTAQKLKTFWKKWYAPSLMTVVVCGDVDILAVEKEIEKTWGKAKGKALRKRRRDLNFQMPFGKAKELQASKTFDVNSIRWIGSLPSVSITDMRLPALDVASSILGQGESSRLHQRVFRGEHLVTGIGAGVWAPVGDGFFSFEAEVPTEKHSMFKKSMYEEVSRFAKEGPTAEELERARVGLESDRIYSSQTMDNIAHRLGFLKTVVGNTHFDLQYLSQVRELSKEDVRLQFKKIMEENSMKEFALFPKGYDTKQFWRGDSPAAAEKKSEPKKAIVAKSSTEGKLVKLSNGIEVVLYPRVDIPVVNINAVTLGGLRSETPDTAGLGSLMSDLWDKGPAGWTAERTSRFLEGKASRVSAFSGKNSTGLSLTTLTHFLEDTLPLYFDTLFQPAFSEEEFAREKRVQLEELKTYADHPSRIADKIFNEAMFEGHPFSWPVVGMQAAVEGFTHEKVKAHFQKQVPTSRLVVSVAGKFNEDMILNALEKQKRNVVSSPLEKKLPLQEIKGPRYVEVQKGREQSHLIYGFRGIPLGHEDRHSLKVLSTYLSGQSGRLFRELRDKQGLCYVVAPMSLEGLDGGYFAVYMGCDPKKREQALKGIAEELQRLVEKPLSEADVKKAKDFLLGRHHMDLQSNSTVSSTSALSQLYGIGHDEHLRMAQNLKKVSAASIRKVAARILSQPSVTAVVI